jgi:hypothetical protein
MQTIVTKKINNKNVIVGIGQALIDGPATKPIVEKAIKKTDEFKDFEKLMKESARYCEEAQKALIASKEAKKVKDLKNEKLHYENFKARIFQYQDLQKNIVPVARALKQKKKELIKQFGICFEPKLGEELIDDQAAEEIRNDVVEARNKKNEIVVECDENDKLDFSKRKEVINKIGQKYWVKNGDKWEERKIIDIDSDIPTDGFLYDDLTDKQKKEIVEQLKTTAG